MLKEQNAKVFSHPDKPHVPYKRHKEKR